MFKHPTGNVPKTVVILGMGPTRRDFLDILASGDPHALNHDEVWGINTASNITPVDVSFIMDDYAAHKGHHEALTAVYEHADHPVITSTARPECPTAVSFPLAEILNMNPRHGDYLNHTAAYMLAYAAWLGVEEVIVFGIDYISQEKSYAQSKNLADLPPRYMACAGYWAGYCAALGMNVTVTPNSPFMDADYLPQQRLYGYLIKPVINREPVAPTKPHLVEDKEQVNG